MFDQFIEVGWRELAVIIERGRFEWIQKRAYFKWLDAGSPVSDGVEFWLAAEKDWEEEARKPIELPVINFPPIIIDDISSVITSVIPSTSTPTLPSIISDNLISIPPIEFGPPPVIEIR